MIQKSIDVYIEMSVLIDNTLIGNIMDLCFMILSNPVITDVAQRKLQGRAMECGTLLGRCYSLGVIPFVTCIFG